MWMMLLDNSIIKFDNVTKEFIHNKQIVKAIDNINFEVKKNSLVLLKGKSGSGKSTILSLIASLSKPSKGTIFVNDTEITKLPDSFASEFRNQHIGFIFQKFNLIQDINVYENVLLPLMPQNLPQKEVDKKISNALKLFAIELMF